MTGTGPEPSLQTHSCQIAGDLSWETYIGRMSVAEETRRLLKERPHYLRSLGDGVANLRALARRLKPALERRTEGEVGEEAVVSALRRVEFDLGPSEEVLKGSRVTLRRNVGVITVEAGLSVASDVVKTAKSVSSPEFLRIIQGERKTTIVAHEEDLEGIEEALDRPALVKEEGLTELVVTSPEEIEEEPGIIAEMTSRLFAVDINIREMMSCNTDTIFVLDEGDAPVAAEALEFRDT